MFEAARVTDPIEHTSALTGFLIGAVLGVALIAAVAFATLTCGFGVALLAGLAAGVGASAILGLGEAIGKSRWFTSTTGTILTGSTNVFVNGKLAAFAMASTVACSKHSPVPLIAQGSGGVFINSKPAARKGDKITCGAAVADGSANVFMGGGTQTYLPYDDEVPPWLRTTVDWAFALAGLVGGLAGLVKAAGGLSRAVLPCAAKFIGGYVIGEAVGRYVAAPVVSRVMGGLFGHPVDVTTGRKVLLADDETDAIVPSPMPLVCRRFYASNLDSAGTLGRGWVLPWDLRLHRRDGRLWYTDAQGRESGFPLVAPGQMAFSDTEQRYLTCTPDGRYILHDLSETYYDFGRLDAEGDGVAWVRRIEDQAGQWQDYARDGEGRVREILTSGGVRVALDYEPLHGRLAAIATVRDLARQVLVAYGYDDAGQLASVTDANGIVVRRFSYADGRMTHHVNALGFTCSYEWAEVAGAQRVVATHTSDGEHWTFGYDIEARESWTRHEDGRTARWRYDERFQVVACTDLDGGHYAIDYNAAGMPVSVQLPGDRRIAFEYDEAGRIVHETDPLGRVTRTRYDGNSLRPAQVTLPDGSNWQSTYDRQGRLLGTLDPLGRTERYEYPDGLTALPAAQIDAHGGRKTLEWNLRGQLVAYTDCSSKTTHYEYDEAGQLTGIVNALGERTGYARRPTGEVLAVALPDGSAQTFEYDAAGLPVRHTGTGERVRRWTRNTRGQVLEAIDPAGRALRYRYDSEGRLTELAAATGARYAFGYDAAGRLQSETRPDGVVRRFRYGAAGELAEIETTGAPDAATDRATRQPQTAAAPTRTARFERDALGDLLAQHTATEATHYTRDPLGRLLSVERIPTQAGLALGVEPDTVSFDYDKAGRLVAEHGTNGTVRYTLDALDNIEALDLPHGPSLRTLRYGSGHVHQVRSGEQVVSDIERDDLHREVLRTQGRLVQRTGYDTLGRQVWQSSDLLRSILEPERGRLWRSYRYDASGELAERRDSVRGSVRYRYDPAGQLLQQARLADNSVETFAWDAAGNLLDETERSSRGHIEGNRLRMWQDMRFEYDAWGNLSVKCKGANQVQRFTYDGQDRLLAVRTETLRGVTETRFTYDPLGRRIAKHETQTETVGMKHAPRTWRFVWQGLRLAQEIRETGTSSYVYSPDAPYTPAARVDALIAEAIASAAIDTAKRAAQIYHFHTDLVGAPLEVTDEAGDLVWAGRYGAWGKVERGEDSRLTPRIEQPLRYAGQYADEGTGLHYNTFRYYDPDVGRFISQDPIGHLGGENLYAYGANPTGWTDPWGWCSTKLGKNMGARTGDGMANHHLIPEELMKHPDYAAMFKRLRSMGFDGDGASNGTFLPGSSQLAKDMGLPGHWSNHDQFTAAVEVELKKLNQQFLAGRLSDTQLALGIGRVQNMAREGLESGKYVVDAITGRLL
ncbi:RHS repeat-associated core domain-containing protein [Ralstonia solanacearum]|uniref:RHS repeat-associated core domain-containing protein n=1 Tax=Ralstonia solanacearum TaxID=305 RepID=UPI0006DC1BDE|nr:RHS repeat-associated core domain-containing protein [Ralstonia solanacearum]